MEILGTQILTEPPRHHFGAVKRVKYSAAGAAILRSLSSHFKVPKKPLEKWLGQIGFASRSAPIVRAWSQVLRSLLPSGWEHNQHVHLSQIAQSTLQFILKLLHFEEGTALFYRRAPMTNSTRSVWWRFHDAAKSPCPNGKFKGFSAWLWQHGSSHVYYYFGRWRDDEMQTIDISALEFHNMAMAASPDFFTDADSFEDIIARSDHALGRSASAAGTCNAPAEPASPSLRHLASTTLDRSPR
jgi:hypothetical protein